MFLVHRDESSHTDIVRQGVPHTSIFDAAETRSINDNDGEPVSLAKNLATSGMRQATLSFA